MKRFLCSIITALCAAGLLACAGAGTPTPEMEAEPLPAEHTDAPVLILMNTPKPVPQDEPAFSPEPTARQDEPTTFSLRFVGDLMCCNYQIADALRPDGSYDFHPSFAAITGHLQGADVLFGNLETNVFDKKPINGEKKFFNAPPEYLDAVKDCGFQVLFTANNHALDVGAEGQLATNEAVRARGMEPVGSNRSAEEREQIYYRDVRGVRMAVLSYTGFTNKDEPDDFQLDGVEAPWIINLYTAEQMRFDVTRAREGGAEVVVMYLHEGWEKTTEPNKRQRAAADAAFDAGVDVLIMSHTHSLLPMEKRQVVVDGVEKTVFCAYGLGNFMSSALPEEALNNIILDLSLTYDPALKRLTGIDARYLLTYTYNYYDENRVRRFVVVGMEDALADPSSVPPLVTTNPERVRRARDKMTERIGTDDATPVRAF